MTERNKWTATRPGAWKVPWGDASLSALLAAQVLILFVALPLGAIYPSGRALLDMVHLAFAAVCALALTGRRAIRAALLAGLLCSPQARLLTAQA